MNFILGLAVATVLASLSFVAHAQGLPPGSYQQSCRDFRMHGTTLSAVCRRANGRGEQQTALSVAHCVGDIGNNNGQLQCNGGQPASPPPPRQGPGPGYGAPGYAPPPGYGEDRRWGEGNPGPGSPLPPGYGPDRRYSEAQEFQAHCDRLRGIERDLRDRLQYTPPSYERERLQNRLDEVHAERRQCWRR
jgi:CVNH domain